MFLTWFWPRLNDMFLAHFPWIGPSINVPRFASPLPGVELQPLKARGLQALPGRADHGGWRSLGSGAGAERLRISGAENFSLGGGRLLDAVMM